MTLKEKYQKLSHTISYRTDSSEEIEIKAPEAEDADAVLCITAWNKTEGEQWGNCHVKKISFIVGKKAIKMKIYATTTNSNSWTNSTIIDEVDFKEIYEMAEEIIGTYEEDYNGSEADVAKLCSQLNNTLMQLMYSANEE